MSLLLICLVYNHSPNDVKTLRIGGSFVPLTAMLVSDWGFGVAAATAAAPTKLGEDPDGVGILGVETVDGGRCGCKCGDCSGV